MSANSMYNSSESCVNSSSVLCETNTSSSCVIPERITGSWLIVLTVFGAIFSVVSVVGNGIIILAFIRTKALRKSGNVLLTNLALGDFLYASAGFPVYIIIDFYNELYCNAAFASFRLFITILVVLMSLNNMAVIALERFIGIQYPFFYQVHFTTNRMYFAALGSWIFGIVRSFALASAWHGNVRPALSVELTITFSLLALTTFVYFRVYQISKFHLNRDKSYGIRNQESKSQTAVFIALVNAFSWAPVILVRFIDTAIVDTSVLVQTTFMFPFLGTTLNLAVYTYRMRDYRRAVRRLFPNVMRVMPLAGNTVTNTTSKEIE